MLKMRRALLIFTVSFLCFIGLLFIFSITSVRSEGLIFFKKQLVALGLGVCLFIIASRTPPQVFGKLAPALYLLSLLLLALTLVLPGEGAKRWIRLPGFSFQPVELTKFAVILVISLIVARKLDRKGQLDFNDVIAIFFVILPPSFLLILQPDFGSVVQLLSLAMFFIFVAGYSVLKILGLTLLSFIPLALLVISSPYRIRRVKVMLDPWSDRYGAGFQIVQSILSFAGGGAFGKGIGAGTGKLFFLPAAHTDLIISAIAEEMGFVGVLVVTSLFFLLGLAIFSVAITRKDTFLKLAVGGVGFLVVSQALLNMLVAVGALPAKGLPLPFVSYGGSALMIFLLQMGFVFSADLEKK